METEFNDEGGPDVVKSYCKHSRHYHCWRYCIIFLTVMVNWS